MRPLRHFSHVSFLHAQRGISRLAGEGKDQEKPGKSRLEANKFSSSPRRGRWDRVAGPRGAVVRDHSSSEADGRGQPRDANSQGRQAEAGAGRESRLAKGRGVVTGPALCFGRSALPTGLQGCAPGKAHEKGKSTNPGEIEKQRRQKRDIPKEL